MHDASVTHGRELVELQAVVGDLESQILARDEELKVAEQEISNLTNEIDETVKKSEEVVAVWKGMYVNIRYFPWL